MIIPWLVVVTFAPLLCSASFTDASFWQRWSPRSPARCPGRAASETTNDSFVKKKKKKEEEEEEEEERWTLLEDRLPRCRSGTQVRNLLPELLPTEPRQRYYQSVVIPSGAAQQALSDGDLAIQLRMTRSRYSISELLIDVSDGNRDAQRLSIGIGATLILSTAMAIAINQSPLFLMGPDIVRFLLVWIFVFLPLGMIGYGIRDAQALQSLLLRVQEPLDPQLRVRRIQHEAGHFLMGHLLGFPIQGYRIDGLGNNGAAVQFYPPADPDLGSNIARQLGFDPLRHREFGSRDDVSLTSTTTSDPTTAWPYRGFSAATLDTLAVIGVSGMVAELLALGNAYGGRVDLEQLQEFARYPAEEEEKAMERMETRIRFALGFAASILRRHLPQLDALSAVMEREGSVAECIRAIEESTMSISIEKIRDNEVQRRKHLRSNKSVWERIQPFLGIPEAPHIDALMDDDDGWVQGKGGGARKKAAVRLAGDDPLYLALTAATVILAWASAGGISLH
jgi:hypothetical protein